MTDTAMPDTATSDTAAPDTVAPDTGTPDTGTPPEPPQSSTAVPAVRGPGSFDPATRDQRNWAMFSHLIGLSGFVIPFGNIIGPLLMWLLKREEWPLADDQGKESLNFQINWTILFFVTAILCLVVVGFALLPIVMIAGLILVVMATIKASEGERFRYPFIYRFIR